MLAENERERRWFAAYTLIVFLLGVIVGWVMSK